MKKTAKQMFEDIGYKEATNEHILSLRNDMFEYGEGHDLEYLQIYVSTETITRYMKYTYYGINIIEIDNISQMFSEFDYDTKIRKEIPIRVELEELKAINKYCQEKGWLNE